MTYTRSQALQATSDGLLVSQYFQMSLGKKPTSKVLQEVNCGSPCGKDCCAVINKAADFLEACGKATHVPQIEVNAIVRLAEESCIVFIRG